MSLVPTLPPPRPRDGAPTLSEVLPFGSRKISMWRSTALLPVVLVAGTAVVLFNLPRKSVADFMMYMNVMAAATLLFSFLLLYIYSGERKNPLWYVIPAAVTIVQLDTLLGPYIYVFRKVLPGNTDATGFLPTFVGMFFGAGLMEETMKGIPLLFGLAVALWLRRTGSPGGAFTRGIAVQGPVDGLLMGAAAGAGFIMIETMTMYVPRTVEAFKSPDHGLLVGMTLMIPRVIKGIIGHMAYAGIFGYFVGLAATHNPPCRPASPHRAPGRRDPPRLLEFGRGVEPDLRPVRLGRPDHLRVLRLPSEGAATRGLAARWLYRRPLHPGLLAAICRDDGTGWARAATAGRHGRRVHGRRNPA